MEFVDKLFILLNIVNDDAFKLLIAIVEFVDKLGGLPPHPVTIYIS